MHGDLRTKLWNIIYKSFIENLPYNLYDFDPTAKLLFEVLWHSFFKNPIDTIPKTKPKILEHIRTWFFTVEWYEVYDFVEVLAKFGQKHTKKRFDELVNAVLEEEVAGYRILNLQVTPITDEKEIREIELALETARNLGLQGVFEHIDNALGKLADRQNPDYRNSIKESISAVESVAKSIAGAPKATLDDALKAIEAKIGVHPALKKGFLSIYGYTSDDDGIRHSLLEQSTCDFEDAKYMLVSCTAFVNYLIVKAQKAQIKLTRSAAS